MNEAQQDRIDKAAQFAHSLAVRNEVGNLSAGWLVEKGEEIANLAHAFSDLHVLMDQIRSLASGPLVLKRGQSVTGSHIGGNVTQVRGVQLGNGNSQVNTF